MFTGKVGGGNSARVMKKTSEQKVPQLRKEHLLIPNDALKLNMSD